CNATTRSFRAESLRSRSSSWRSTSLWIFCMATWIPESASRNALTTFGLGRTGVLAAIAREPVALAGLLMVVAYAAIALGVGFLPLRDPLQISSDRLAAPTAAFPFGTDALGRDLFSRVLFGARLSMQVAVFSVAAATLVGSVLGLVSGYLGGIADLVIGRVMDVFFAFPAILLALGIVAALGPDPKNVIIAIAVVYTPIFMRVVRGDAQRGAAVPRVRDAPGDLPGSRDHGRRPRVQPPGRRTSRRARPAAPMSRIIRATPAHLGPIATLMATSPLLHRYRVTARGAKASLAEGMRERDV